MKTNNINIRISPTDLQQLKQQAAAHDMSVSEYLRELIRRNKV